MRELPLTTTRTPSPITAAVLLLAGMLLAACGATVPVSGAVKAAPAACPTPQPTLQQDGFSESVHLTTAGSGLQYADLRVGCGPTVKAGSQVTVEYTGWFSDGSQFDSSRQQGRQPFVFLVGTGEVISGFDDGVLGMHPGGKRRLVIPPALAYGSQGHPPQIPPNATVIFDVEVLAVR